MTEQTTETRDTPVDEAGSGPPADGGTTEKVGPNDPSGEEFETFTREDVQELRDEAAGYRVRAKDRDDLAHRLYTALVTATGRLVDPSDLPFDDAHLADPEALSAAVDELLARKPHLERRRVVAGDVGHGVTGSDRSVDLAGMLRRNAS